MLLTLQECSQPAVTALHASDIDFFVRRVRRDDGRAERGHLPVRVFGEKNAAFKAGVYGFDRHVIAIDGRADFFQFFNEVGVRQGLPARVRAAVFAAATRKADELCNTCGKIVAGTIHRGAQHAADMQGIVPGFGNGEVVRGFNQARNVDAHAIHTVVQVTQDADDLGRAFFAKGAADGFGWFEADVQGLVFWGQFVADVCGQFLQVLLCGGEVAAA